MNSLILTAIVSFCKSFAAKFTQSKLWALIMNIYNACSRSWSCSRIMNFAKGGNASVTASRFARLLYLPFTILEWLDCKLRKPISKAVESSVICEWGRLYVHNFMAVNTRFFGVMLLCSSVIYNISHVMKYGGFNKIVLAVSIIGAILSIFNANLMGWMDGSKIVDFFKSCLGFKNISFNFYNEAKLFGKARLITAILVGVLTGGIMSFMPLYGILVPFALFGMLLVLEYPVTGVFAAVFVAPLIPFSSMPLAGICIWTMISVIVKSIIDKNFKWKKEGMGAVLILFLLVLLISCIFSFSMKSSLVVWMMYLIFVSFYFAVINTVENRAQLFGLLRVFVISGFLVAVYGVMQYAFGWTTTNAWIDETMFEDETMRVFSTLANPNVLGEYLLLVLPVSAVFFLKDRTNTLSKWVYLAITGVVFLCLILTQSRGCWLGFMITVAIFVTFYEGRWWAIIPLILCILPFVVPKSIVERLQSIGDMGDSSTSYRVYIWMGAIGMLRHYLAGGIGMGELAFNQVYPFFSYNAIIAPHAHNTFLQLLVEGGIPALLVFLAVIVVYLKKTHVIYKERDKKSKNSAMTLAIAAGICGFLFQSLFDYTFYNYRVMAVFFMLIAITMCFKYVHGRNVAEDMK